MLVKIVEEGNLSQAAKSRLNFFRFRSSIEGLSFAGVDDVVLEAFSNLVRPFTVVKHGRVSNTHSFFVGPTLRNQRSRLIPFRKVSRKLNGLNASAS